MADIIITLPTGTEITFDEKWKWFPLYEDVEELMTIDNSDCHIYWAWINKYFLSVWYAENIEHISDEMIDFIDREDLGNWLIDKYNLLELSTGTILALSDVDWSKGKKVG